MIRLPNPKSDIKEYIRIMSILVKLNKNSITIDDIKTALALEGNISSQKNIGTLALKASHREDKSRDAVFNQSKAISEILRLLGLVKISDSNQHTFDVTEFGKRVALYESLKNKENKEDIINLLCHSFLNINYKHPQILGNEDYATKPFLLALRIIDKIEGFITKDEFIYYILSQKSDDPIIIDNIAKQILIGRENIELFISNKKQVLGNLKESTVGNYTRIPMAFFKVFKLLKKQKISEISVGKKYINIEGKYIDGGKVSKNKEIYTVDTEGEKILNELKLLQSIKFSDLENECKEIRIYTALKSLEYLLNKKDSIILNTYLKTKYSSHYSENKKFFAFPYTLLLVDEIIEFELILKEINLANSFGQFPIQEKVKYYKLTKKIEYIKACLNKKPCSGEDILGCFNCSPTRCYKFSEDEVKSDIPGLQGVPDNANQNVCPTGALDINEDGFPFIDYSKCIDCGICISRCKYGAIHYQDDKLIISKIIEGIGVELIESSEYEAMNYFKAFNPLLKYELDSDELFARISNFFRKNKSLKKEGFYPLVRNLLRCIGLKTNLGKSGDTQWRYDAVVIEPFIMPIEIKSPTESETINPNSIRQAIENSITIEANHNLSKNPKSAVIALLYENARGASEGMLKDAHSIHNIQIILISVVILVYLVYKNNENKFTSKDIGFLFNNTIGAFDINAIKEFRINYLVRRKELVILGKSSSYSDIKDEIFDLDFIFNEKLKKEFDLFVKIFTLVRPSK